MKDFNPRSPRGGATIIRYKPGLLSVNISIHAPHEGERRKQAHLLRALQIFQSTLPTRGSDHNISPYANLIIYFNPRSPRGGATSSINFTFNHNIYFNPRSPRGGATMIFSQSGAQKMISIHAPHEGERPFCFYKENAATNFNPRSPRGGATCTLDQRSYGSTKISIHAPHEGERRRLTHRRRRKARFQSTLPTRGSDHSSQCT